MLAQANRAITALESLLVLPSLHPTSALSALSSRDCFPFSCKLRGDSGFRSADTRAGQCDQSRRQFAWEESAVGAKRF